VRRKRRLSVTVPAGIEGGSQIRLSDEGEPGFNGAGPGDLYVSVRVRAHPLFERDGNDVLHRQPVNIAAAALGATIKVPTLDGEADLTVPPGTQSGQAFRLKGMGVTHLRNQRQRGDHLVHVFVETPRSLSDRQRELLLELSKTLDDGSDGDGPDDKGWIGKIKGTFRGSD
jgi:molecular chaperone DnaJ